MDLVLVNHHSLINSCPVKIQYIKSLKVGFCGPTIAINEIPTPTDEECKSSFFVKLDGEECQLILNEVPQENLVYEEK